MGGETEGHEVFEKCGHFGKVKTGRLQRENFLKRKNDFGEIIVEIWVNKIGLTELDSAHKYDI